MYSLLSFPFTLHIKQDQLKCVKMVIIVDKQDIFFSEGLINSHFYPLLVVFIINCIKSCKLKIQYQKHEKFNH